MKRKKILAEVMENMASSYDLVYVSYDDKLTTSQVAAVAAGDYETLDSEMMEWESDSRYAGAEYEAKELLRDTCQNLFRRDLIDDVDEAYDKVYNSEAWEEITEAIRERDNSNAAKELAGQSGWVLMRQVLLNEDQSMHRNSLSVASIVEAFQKHTQTTLKVTEQNTRAIEQVIAEVEGPTGGVMGMILYAARVSDLFELMGHQGVVAIKNPYLYLGNPFVGDGYVSDDPLEATFYVDRKDLTTDESAFGYGWDAVTGGVTISAYEADVSIPTTDFSTPEKIIAFLTKED